MALLLNYKRPLGIYIIIKEPKASIIEILKEYLKYSKLFSNKLEIRLLEYLY